MGQCLKFLCIFELKVCIKSVCLPMGLVAYFVMAKTTPTQVQACQT